MYTPEEISSIRAQARFAGLSAPALFWRATPSELVKICNGCGAEDMPEWARCALTWLYRHYAPAHAIHDCDYELSDGTELRRAEADARFNANCLLLWQKKYGALRYINPVALYARNKVRVAYKALTLCGAAAWLAAHQKTIGGAA